ncbi:MAG: restriction endonuclease subunit S [Nitrososphaerota archaeon]|nr:restriction endonuclease subunit S [Nitrososphaerota archaeon]
MVRLVPIREQINSEYLAAFLSCKYGIAEIRCRARQSINQTNVNPEEVKEIWIPLLNSDLQHKIKECFLKAHNLRLQANETYASAGILLLSALGLDTHSFSTESVVVKSFSDSFCASGRLDAEYYQQKYDELFERLSNFKCIKLGKKHVSITKSIEPGSKCYGDVGVPFVRVSDITKFGIQPSEVKIPMDLTDLRPHKDTILLSKDGSIGIAYKVEKKLDCITSSALLHLIVKSKDILPDYLTLLLNSIVVQLQAERDAGGSIIQHWKPSEIEKVIIPVLDMSIQKQITVNVQRSFALRHESERLLESAKHAVEIAIENGEDAAMKFFKITV